MSPKIGISNASPLAAIHLRAGALSASFEDGMLRYLRVADDEIIRGVYAAVRDHNWGTIPGQLRDVALDVRENSFDVRFTSEHQHGDIHFVWDGHITGSAKSIIHFTFDGRALTNFKHNRIGFCVLYPMELAGTDCTIKHVDGSVEKFTFPIEIAPYQPAYNIRAISYELANVALTQVIMEGDIFEMEDQRNWTDASYKTYCTPLIQPIPLEVVAGTEIHQSVIVQLKGTLPITKASEHNAILKINLEDAHPLPPVGLARSSVMETLNPKEVTRLQKLHLAHLRHDVYFDEEVETRLRTASREARALGCGLELALHLSHSPEVQLQQVVSVITAENTPIARWLILSEHAHSTPAHLVTLARHILGEQYAPIGAGTNGYFTQVNRERPPTGLIDALVYSINPQVHAFDDASLIETLPTQRTTVQSARAYSDGAQIVVSPITFKIRWNPDETAPDLPDPGVLPRQVDPRQASLFGAAWTMGSIKSLLVADSVTYFETVGWLGVMEREGGSPLSDQFPSIAGGVFPLYHIFADIGEFVDGEYLDCSSSDSLTFDGFALRLDNKFRVLVANYTDEKQTITIEGISGMFRARILDETTVETAMRAPEAFRAEHGTILEAASGHLRLELSPYALACLDTI